MEMIIVYIFEQLVLKIKTLLQKQRFEERSAFVFKLPFIFLCHKLKKGLLFCEQLLSCKIQMCTFIGTCWSLGCGVKHLKSYVNGCTDGSFFKHRPLLQRPHIFVIISFFRKESHSLTLIYQRTWLERILFVGNKS